MKRYLPLLLAVISFFSAQTPAPCAADEIPKTAWRRPLGQPLPSPGVRKNKTDIDDGYWQGAPVGGFGAGTFSRTYRGDFARWHIKSGVHKYAPVYANQFAMFQQVAGEPVGAAQVLMTDHPKNGELSSWQWDYPVGAGEYAALFPKSLGQISRTRCAGTVLPGSARQLQRVELSSSGLQVARSKSHK